MYGSTTKIWDQGDKCRKLLYILDEGIIDLWRTDNMAGGAGAGWSMDSKMDK